MSSQDHESAGNFGRWITDEWELPAYHYECDHLSDPQAAYLAMGTQHRRHWHQLGNDRIIAIADNHGGVQVYQSEGGAKWLNFLDPRQMQYAGGLGYLTDGQQVWATQFNAYPEGADFSRRFGIGYLRKIVSEKRLTLDHIIFAPFGDHPLLISQAQVENTGSAPLELDYFEYWGSYQYQLAYDAFIASYGTKDYKVRDASRAELARGYAEEIVFDQAHRALTSRRQHPDHKRRPEGPGFHDLKPPDCFLAYLGADQPRAFETSADGFLQDGSIQRPGGVAARRLSSKSYTAKPGDPRRGCLVMQHPLSLKPGERRLLVHAFGYLTEGASLDSVLADFKPAPETRLTRSLESWKQTLPVFDCPKAPWARRESIWNGYNLRAGSSYDAYFDSHILSQGCTYQYQTGFNAAARDPLQHALPTVLFCPELAKETLRYTMRETDQKGNIPYAICGHGQVAPVHWRPSDNDLWLLWLTTEYVLATRDSDFLAEEVTFYPKEDGRKSPVIDRLRLALSHLLEKVGRGKHGLLKIKNGDWNDGIIEEIPTELWDATMQGGETILNSAMAAYVLPYTAELFTLAGDRESAERARTAGAEIAEAVRQCWTGEWYSRAYACDQDGQELWVGKDRLFLEPQPWALIADIPSGEQAARLITNLDQKLRSPSPIGAVMAHPPREKVMEAKLDLDPDGGNLFWGGVWYALNGTLVWSLGKHDPKMAWDELYKNSFAAHAAAYPHVWFGIWSGPDCYNGHHSARPGYTWGQGTFVDMNEFPVMCLHSHAWPLYALMKLCGISFTAKGISVQPRLPHDTFSLTTPLLSIDYHPDRISGHYTPTASGEVALTLKTPPAWKDADLTARIDDRTAQFTREGDLLTLDLSTAAKRVSSFEITRESDI